MKFFSIILFACCLLVFAQAPQFNGPTFIYEGSTQIDVGYFASPYIYDWDGDTKKDMILGQFSYGYIRFYQNIGTDPAPLFDGYQFLYASGSQITLPSG